MTQARCNISPPFQNKKKVENIRPAQNTTIIDGRWHFTKTTSNLTRKNPNIIINLDEKMIYEFSRWNSIKEKRENLCFAYSQHQCYVALNIFRRFGINIVRGVHNASFSLVANWMMSTVLVARYAKSTMSFYSLHVHKVLHRIKSNGNFPLSSKR